MLGRLGKFSLEVKPANVLILEKCLGAPLLSTHTAGTPWECNLCKADSCLALHSVTARLFLLGVKNMSVELPLSAFLCKFHWLIDFESFFSYKQLCLDLFLKINFVNIPKISM